jgi:hypothetical protein
MYATAILRDLFEPMNSDLSQYITIHRSERSISKIRKNYAFIRLIYTIDDLPICHYIHRQLSPSISVR